VSNIMIGTLLIDRIKINIVRILLKDLARYAEWTHENTE